MRRRRRATAGPPESLEQAKALVVGDRVRFHGESQARFKVRARGERYVVLTKPFNAQHTVLYTVIDLHEAVRGPDDSWGTGYETAEEIAEALAKLEAGEVALSQRASVSLWIAAVKPTPQPPAPSLYGGVKVSGPAVMQRVMRWEIERPFDPAKPEKWIAYLECNHTVEFSETDMTEAAHNPQSCPELACPTCAGHVASTKEDK